MRLSTEAIVEGVFATEGWALTPMQRAICRVRDGVPLGDELREDASVLEGIGGTEAVEALPSEQGVKPSEHWLIASARTAKTTIAVAGAVVDTMNLEPTWGPGEIPRVSLTSVKLDVTDVPFWKARAVFDHPLLKPLLLDERVSDRTLLVRHPSGRPIEFKVVAGGKAAGGLAARWCAGLLADEAPRQSGREDDNVTNLADVLSVVRERLLPGAQIQCVGSPWAPQGPSYDVVESYFGKPRDGVVCLRMTGPAGNPVYWTPERLDELQRKDPIAWRINALGEFIDPETGMYGAQLLGKRTRERPWDLPRIDGALYAAAADPSGGAADANAFAMVILELRPSANGEAVPYRVAMAKEWRGLRPEQIWEEIARDCLFYGCTTCAIDNYAAPANADLARRYGLDLVVEPTTQATKVEDHGNLATLLATDMLELHPEPLLRRDLLGTKRRATQNGFTIVLPKTADGRHGDLAAALAGALRWILRMPRPLTHAEVRANHQQAAMLNRLSGGFDHWEVDDAGQLVHLIHA